MSTIESAQTPLPREIEPRELVQSYEEFSTSAETYLEEFADNWKVDSDVADASGSLITELAPKVWTLTLDVSRKTEQRTLPRSQYVQAVEDRVSAAEQYQHDPNNFDEKTVEFVENGVSPQACGTCHGETVVTCPSCNGDTHVTCSTCSGDGVQRCSDCRGQGEVDCANCGGHGEVDTDSGSRACRSCNGTGTVGCSTCNSSGSHRCKECGGEGRVSCSKCNATGNVTCGTCDGDGELVTAEYGTLEFESDGSFSGTSEIVPDGTVASATGRKLNQRRVISGRERDEDGKSLYRKQVTTYEVPVARVDYTYGDADYELHVTGTDADVGTEEYPKSAARSVVPIVGVLLAIVTAGGALYYFDMLPI